MAVQRKTPSTKRNWRAAARPTARGILQLFKLGFVASALESFREAFEESAEKLPAAHALWCETLSLALADGLRASRVTVLQTDDELTDAIAEFLANAFEAGAAFGEGDLIDPTNFAGYRPVRDAFPMFARRIDPELPADADEEALRTTLDESLRRGLVQAWSGNLARYGEITAQFEGPVAEGAKRQAAWMRHYGWIRDKFENAPVFSPDDLELKVKLRDVYVPLRGVWHEEIGDPDEEESKVPEREVAREKKRRIAHVGMLHDLVQEWLEDSKSSEELIRVVAGGPGSGKSSFARAFASEALRGRRRVVLVELQHMRLTGNLRDDLTRYFRDCNATGAGFYDDALSWRAEDKTPYLLIFDGLDELARSEDRATDLTRRFINNLQWMLRQSSEPTTPIKALVLGRSTAAEEGRKEAELPLETLLHVVPLRPPTRSDLGLEGGLASPHADSSEPGEVEDGILDPDGLLAGDAADQRPLYWTNWTRANEQEGAGVPDGLIHKDLDALNAEPLLLHLLIVSGYLTPDKWRMAADNRNVVYEAIFQKVYERDKTAGKWSAAKIDLGDFFTLMECLGLASWAGGGRAGSDQDFEKIRAAHAPGKREKKYKEIPNAGLKGVAVQFYTRQDLGDTGFEFIHKTFGEYLIARALLAAAKRACSRLEDSNEETTAKEWVKISGSAEITDVILRFLRDEIRRLPLQKTKELKDALEELMSWKLWSGMPAHMLEEVGSYREIESRQRYAEGALLIVLNACARHLAADNLEAAMIQLNWPDSLSLQLMLERLRVTGPYYQSVSHSLSHLSAFVAEDRAIFPWLSSYFTAINLADVDLEEANFQRMFGHKTDFERANLAKINLQEARVSEVNLRSANLWGANLTDANPTVANLEGANLTGANLADANITGANLTGANLTDANLKGANLKGANLTGANLDGANLDGANLEGAKR